MRDIQVDVHEDRQWVCVWLTHEDERAPGLADRLRGLIRTYRDRKLQVAVFHSGTEDLAETTGELLRYNRRRMAEEELREEQGPGMRR